MLQPSSRTFSHHFRKLFWHQASIYYRSNSINSSFLRLSKLGALRPNYWEITAIPLSVKIIFTNFQALFCSNPQVLTASGNRVFLGNTLIAFSKACLLKVFIRNPNWHIPKTFQRAWSLAFHYLTGLLVLNINNFGSPLVWPFKGGPFFPKENVHYFEGLFPQQGFIFLRVLLCENIGQNMGTQRCYPLPTFFATIFQFP